MSSICPFTHQLWLTVLFLVNQIYVDQIKGRFSIFLRAVYSANAEKLTLSACQEDALFIVERLRDNDQHLTTIKTKN